MLSADTREIDTMDGILSAVDLFDPREAELLLADNVDPIRSRLLANGESLSVHQQTDFLPPSTSETAMRWWRQHQTELTAACCVDFFACVLEKHEIQDFLPDLLQRNAATNEPLKSERLNRYDLIPVQAEESTGSGVLNWWLAEKDGVNYCIWLDAPIGFLLTYKGHPNAIVGFEPHGDKGIKIHQIQGVKGYKVIKDGETESVKRVGSRGLPPLDWQQLLLQAVYTVGIALQRPNITLVGSKNIPWTSSSFGEKEEFTTDTAVNRYDEVAKRLGFIALPNGDWRMSIQTAS